MPHDVSSDFDGWAASTALQAFGRSLGLVAALLGTISMVQAKDRVVDCYLKVDRTVYLNRKCNFSPSEDGSFSMGTAPEGGQRAEPYFVYVNKNDDGSAEASWNEVPSASHAQAPLGTVRRTGACWMNERAKICAFSLPAGEFADLEDAPAQEPATDRPSGSCDQLSTAPKRQ